MAVVPTNSRVLLQTFEWQTATQEEIQLEKEVT